MDAVATPVVTTLAVALSLANGYQLIGSITVGFQLIKFAGQQVIDVDGYLDTGAMDIGIPVTEFAGTRLA